MATGTTHSVSRPDHVFVSSTCYDLLDLRSELRDCISEMGLVPRMSDLPDTEFRVAGEGNSIEACLVNLAECDTVIVVLSQRYGPTLEAYGHKDVSATHLEYRHAVKLQKKVLFYARDTLLGWASENRGETVPKRLKGMTDKDAVPMLAFLAEHSAPPAAGSGRSNFCSPFTTSSDLKGRLRVDLAQQSTRAIFKARMDAGNLPVLYFRHGGGSIDAADLELINAGPVPVQNVTVYAKEDGDRRSYPAISVNGSALIQFNLRTLFPHGAHAALNINVVPLYCEFMTMDGLRVKDTHAMRVGNTLLPMKLLRRELVEIVDMQRDLKTRDVAGYTVFDGPI